ncbi:MAG: DUF4350 domain-containing protein [Steroidobacteraceae bacterium]
MKDRWITLGFAALAFVAFYRFFVGPAYRPEEEHSRPLSTEARANGYLALRRWLELQGIPVGELRHRYDWLQRAAELPPGGNLLVITIPFKRAARQSELRELRAWLWRGNSVLVAAGLFDTPEWAVPETNTFGQLYGVTGIEIRFAGDEEDGAGDVEDNAAPDAAAASDADAEEPAPDPPPTFPPPELRRLPEPKHSVLRPIAGHALTRGVLAVHAESEYPAGLFRAVSPASAPMLALMQDEESRIPALWLSWRGEGRLLVSGYGSVFTNKMLARGENAALMANAIEQLLGPGGHVIFDDMHQGAASFYDAEAFFGDPRLHASFWWIMGLWLIWVLGSTRLPPPSQAAAPSMRERTFATATGNLFARVLDRRGVAERLFANFFNEYRQLLGRVRNGEPLWDWLHANSALPSHSVRQLEALHARVAAGKRVNLIDLHNRLQHLRKQIQ